MLATRIVWDSACKYQCLNTKYSVNVWTYGHRCNRIAVEAVGFCQQSKWTLKNCSDWAWTNYLCPKSIAYIPSDASLWVLYNFITCLLILWSVLKVCFCRLLSYIFPAGLIWVVHFSLTHTFGCQVLLV